MRILGVALLTIFLFALARFVFLQPDVQSLVGLRTEERISHDLVSSLPLEACNNGETPNHYTFIVRESDTWTALAGSPGYNSVSFNMPKEVPVVSGTLILDLSAEIQADSVARMRVNVNGERRGEVILNEGTSRREIRVNLLPSDLTQSQLVVNLAAFGAFPKIACQPGWTGGMVVRIEPSSRVELITDGPLEDLNDRLRATGNPYQLQWPGEHTGINYEQLISFSVDQRLRNIRTDFVPESLNRCPVAVAFSDEDLETAEAITRSAQREFNDVSWPVYIAEEGDNDTAHFFEYKTSWRYDYDLRSTPHAQYPTQLDFGLTIVGLQPQAEWLLAVTLNGQSILGERLIGDMLNIQRSIELPQNLHQFSNTIEIQLISSETQDQVACASGAQIMAQLHSQSILNGGVPAPDSSIGDFINAMTGEIQLNISSDINAAEASSTVSFLAETFGDRVQWAPNETPTYDNALVYVTTRRKLEDRMAAIAAEWTDHDFWLIWPRLPEEGELPYYQIAISELSITDFVLDEGPRIAAIVAVRKPPAVALIPIGTEDADMVEPTTLSPFSPPELGTDNRPPLPPQEE